MPVKVDDEKDNVVIQKCFMLCTYLYNYVDVFKVKKDTRSFKYKLIKNTTTLVDYKIILN